MFLANVFTLLYNIKFNKTTELSLFMTQNVKFKLKIKLSGGYEITQRENSFYNERQSI